MDRFLVSVWMETGGIVTSTPFPQGESIGQLNPFPAEEKKEGGGNHVTIFLNIFSSHMKSLELTGEKSTGKH